MAKSGGDYEVGYKKPPKHTQWKKGQCGFPPGRKRQRRVTLADFETAFDKALNTLVTVNENGTVHQIKKVNALATQIVNKAVKGNPQATNLLLSMFVRRAEVAPESAASGPTADDFKTELEAFFFEIAAKSQPGADPPNDVDQAGNGKEDSGLSNEPPAG